MLLVLDNYDSFTYILCDYLKQLDQELIIIRNDEKTLDEIEELQFNALVISPGPGVPESSGILMPLIARWHSRVPILGICLGHQALGVFFGWSLIKASYPMHGKVSKIHTIGHPMWNDIPTEIEVCRYHSLALEPPQDSSLSKHKDKETKVSQYSSQLHFEIIPTAYSEDDHTLMAFAHKSLPIWGIQFHPEAILSQYGLKILENWLNTFTLQKTY